MASSGRLCIHLNGLRHVTGDTTAVMMHERQVVQRWGVVLFRQLGKFPEGGLKIAIFDGGAAGFLTGGRFGRIN